MTPNPPRSTAMPNPSEHCPFCGSIRMGVFTGRQAKWAVSCLTPACGATGPEGTTPAEAVGRWRTRHTVSAPAPPIAAHPVSESIRTGGALPGRIIGHTAEKQALIDRSLIVFRARLAGGAHA